METENIMRRVCATTATINTAEQKNPGTALMISSMPMECVKTVT